MTLSFNDFKNPVFWFGILFGNSIGILSILLPTITYFVLQGSKKAFSYANKHVMITGGSSGIGLDVAKESLRKGASVVTLIARDNKKLQKAKDELVKMIASSSSQNQRVYTVAVDVGSSQSKVDAALKPCFDEMGKVDVLINSAGTSIAFEFDDKNASSEEFEKMLRVNVLGSIHPTRAVLGAGGMKEQAARNGGARIVFVSSQVAQCALHGYSAYAASKWALRGVAEALQMELKPYDIMVSVSYPPDTDTPGYEVEMQSKPKITQMLNENKLFTPESVAQDIVKYSTLGYFGISTGLDGWLLKQGHAGMTPVNSAWEVAQQVLMGSLARAIGVFYLLSWDSIIKTATKEERAALKKAAN